jgi:hypothetical protein
MLGVRPLWVRRDVQRAEQSGLHRPLKGDAARASIVGSGRVSPFENCFPTNPFERDRQPAWDAVIAGGVETTADIQRFARSTGSTQPDHTFVSTRWIGLWPATRPENPARDGNDAEARSAALGSAVASDSRPEKPAARLTGRPIAAGAAPDPPQR